MVDDNPRKRAIELLKLNSAAIVDSFNRGMNETDAVHRGNLFMQGYVDNMSSQEHQNGVKKLPFTHKTSLKATDFLSEINSGSCSKSISCHEIDDSEALLFAKHLDKPIATQNTGMEVDDNEENRFDDKLFKQQNESENPLKKLKTMNKTNGNEMPTANPWKSKPVGKIDVQLKSSVTTKTVNPFTPSQSLSNYFKPAEQAKVTKPIKPFGYTEKKQQLGLNEWRQPQQQQNIKPVVVEHSNPFDSFKTGRQELETQNANKPKFFSNNNPPFKEQKQQEQTNPLYKKFQCPIIKNSSSSSSDKSEESSSSSSLLKGFDKAILERIEREIISDPYEVTWDDIVGLDNAKRVINESITIAINHPEFFTGLRAAPRAILFFGPPGTGKTLIGKCIASSCSATFMSISASSLTSKWIGESEALVRAMFTYAKLKQPTVIFFDEIDSLLEARDSSGSGGGNETFNRIKTEFLVQLDGVSAMNKNDRVLFIAATNLPHKIDEAIIRRFAKRIYVPLPVQEARVALFRRLLKNERHKLVDEQFEKLGEMSDGYSGSDINQVCKEAAMKPLRKISNVLATMSVNEIPPMSFKHFVKALRDIKPSVSVETINLLEEWNVKYGFSANFSQSDDSDSDDDF